MADLSANAPLRFKGDIVSQRWVLDNSAATHPYKGGPMILDISLDTVYVRAFIDGTDVAADDIFIGIALEEVSVATGDTETDNKINIAIQPSVVGFQSTVYTDADVGDTVYMSDSGTLSSEGSDNPVIGKLIRVEDGYAYIRLSSPTITTAADS